MSSDVKQVCENAGIAKSNTGKRNHGERHGFECSPGLIGTVYLENE